MDEIGAVQILERFRNLIDDVLLVLLLQDVLANDAVQIDLHVLEDEVDVSIVLSSDDVVQFDYVIVLELL